MGRKLLGTTTGSSFSIGVATTDAPGELLRVGAPSGQWCAYRGHIELSQPNGQVQVRNRVDLETYLRGAAPREMPASFGDHGGGRGMHALRAQAVAARSGICVLDTRGGEPGAAPLGHAGPGRGDRHRHGRRRGGRRGALPRRLWAR